MHEEYAGEHNQPRREALMRAALSQFVNHGYYGVAVPKIAKAAGIATGSVYRYFTSKDELVNELYRHWKEVLKRMLTTDYPLDRPIAQQFQFLWQRLYEYADAYSEAFSFIEGHCHASYLSASCLALEDEVFEIGREFIREGQRQGVIRSGPPHVMISMFFGAFVQYFKDCQAERLSWNSETSDLLRDVCWDALSMR